MTQTAEQYSVDHGAKGHDPELYKPEIEAVTVKDFTAIGECELRRYREEGYLAVEQAFTPGEISDALAGLLDLIDGKRPDFRGIQYEKKALDNLSALNLEQKQDAVRKLAYYVKFDPRLAAMAFHEKLLRIAQTILQAEPRLFQDMALIKPPGGGREKPWHQDKAYFNLPVETPVVGFWIALDPATLENGCMQVLSGEHRNGPQLHFQRRDWQLCDRSILGKKSVAVPLPPGGCLILDGLLPHGTPTNFSGLRRRALQFHYAPQDAVELAVQERLKIYGGEGANVEC